MDRTGTRVAQPADRPPGSGDGPSRWTSPVVGLGVSALSRRPRTRFLVRLMEFVVGVGFVVGTLSREATRFPLGLAGAVIGGAAWLAWILSSGNRRRELAALAVWSVAGGVVATARTNTVGTHHTGLVFVGAASAATAFSFGVPTSVATFFAGLVAFLAAGLGYGTLPGPIALMFVVGLGGIVFAAAERQLLERGRESALLATAERRLALADREAQLMTERNRLGRELHDVLAHTLGALSIQITALESRLDAGEERDALRVRIRRLHDLVGDGLQEARDAVRALRDDTLSLELQIRRLCALHGGELAVSGRSRALRADEALALHRVVQEALTNVAKHAVGAPVSVDLSYGKTEVTVMVRNGRGTVEAGPLADSGGGYGLEGMRARVELVGGRCEAGPDGDGWCVTATIPLR